MSRFMAGKSGLSWDTVDRLAELLGLTVTTHTVCEPTKPKGK
jgi:hypothetical protein